MKAGGIQRTSLCCGFALSHEILICTHKSTRWRSSFDKFSSLSVNVSQLNEFKEKVMPGENCAISGLRILSKKERN